MLRRPVLELENWAEIKEEMMVSNVIQRDNIILARKLHPDLEPAAKINDKNVRMSMRIVKLREREGHRVDSGRSLKGHS